MAQGTTPLFHNGPGVRRIKIGVRKFMCMGAPPPFDHPHEFLDMGGDTEAICPYCSTVYEYVPTMRADEADPPECVATQEMAHGATA
ncbi:MAG: zinc-finger domain-containing protein [Pseudomonadota bacterium]